MALRIQARVENLQAGIAKEEYNIKKTLVLKVSQRFYERKASTLTSAGFS